MVLRTTRKHGGKHAKKNKKSFFHDDSLLNSISNISLFTSISEITDIFYKIE